MRAFFQHIGGGEINGDPPRRQGEPHGGQRRARVRGIPRPPCPAGNGPDNRRQGKRAHRGASNPVIDAISAANDVKNDGILIFAIGIGDNIDQDDIADYASDPTDDFTARVFSHNTLETATSNLAEDLLTEATVSVDAPAPLALFGIGFAGLACLRRRRSIAA